MTSQGFVTAVHGTLRLRRGCGRERVVRSAWFLVSRIGRAGDLLLLGWVGHGAAPRPPPRLTIAAALLPASGVTRERTFVFLPEAPLVGLAGRFVPAEGCATLQGEPDRLTVHVVARLPRRLSLHIEGERRAWFGEVL